MVIIILALCIMHSADSSLTDLQCVSRDFDDLLCRWCDVTKPHTDNDIKMFFHYISKNSEEVHECYKYEDACSCHICGKKSGCSDVTEYFMAPLEYSLVFKQNETFLKSFKVIPRNLVKLSQIGIVNVNNVSSHSAVIGWRPVKNDLIERKKLRYRVAVDNVPNLTWTGRPKTICNKVRCTHKMRGLRPFTEYSVSVQVKPKPSKLWSEPQNKTFTTKEAAPFDSPEVKVVEELHDGYYVSWLPPKKTNGVITVTDVMFISEKGKNVTLTSNHTETLITGLSAYTTYTVLLVAYTKEGPSPPSAPRHVTTNVTAPGRVMNVTMEVTDQDATKAEVVLSWEPPDQLNGPEVDYLVTVTWDRGVLLQRLVNGTSMSFSMDCTGISNRILKLVVVAKSIYGHIGVPSDPSRKPICHIKELMPGWAIIAAVLGLLFFLILAVVCFRVCWHCVSDWLTLEPVLPPMVNPIEDNYPKPYMTEISYADEYAVTTHASGVEHTDNVPEEKEDNYPKPYMTEISYADEYAVTTHASGVEHTDYVPEEKVRLGDMDDKSIIRDMASKKENLNKPEETSCPRTILYGVIKMKDKMDESPGFSTGSTHDHVLSCSSLYDLDDYARTMLHAGSPFSPLEGDSSNISCSGQYCVETERQSVVMEGSADSDYTAACLVTDTITD